MKIAPKIKTKITGAKGDVDVDVNTGKPKIDADPNAPKVDAEAPTVKNGETGTVKSGDGPTTKIDEPDPPGTIRDAKTKRFVKDPKTKTNGNTTKTGENGRPTWQKSEADAAKKHGYDDTQVSFKNGKRLKTGESTKGSTRPDGFKAGPPPKALEVKNYDVTSPAGISRLKSNIKKQFQDRIKHLPKNTKFEYVIDVRGQALDRKNIC